MMMQNATGERSAMMDRRWREREKNRCKFISFFVENRGEKTEAREKRGEREEKRIN